MIKFNESGDVITENLENTKSEQIKYLIIEKDDTLERLKETETIVNEMLEDFEFKFNRGFYGLYHVTDSGLIPISGMAYSLARIVDNYGDRF